MMERLAARLSLRLRVFLFFALAGLGGFAMAIAALVTVAQQAPDEMTRPLTLWVGGAAVASFGLIVWIWRQFDEHMARPIERIGRGAMAAAHGGAREVGEAAYLGALAPGAKAAADALAEERAKKRAAVAEATARTERRCRRLEAVLRDLDQGVMLCGLDHRILLYNRRALDLLGACGDVGLGRPLFDLVAAQPFEHALETAQARAEAAGGAAGGCTAPFVAATTDGARALQGRLALVPDEDGEGAGCYLLTFDDVTAAHIRRIARDRDLRAGRKGLVSALDAGDVDGARDALARFDMICAAATAAAWAMQDVYSATLFTAIIRRRTGAQNFSAEIVGQGLWLRADSVALVEALDTLLNRLADGLGVRAFTLEAAPLERRVALRIRWRGPAAPAALLERWRGGALDAVIGGMTAAEVLAVHATDLAAASDGDAHRLEIAVDPAAEAHVAPPAAAPARPEFYDFDLVGRPMADGMDGDAPLSALSYVVFDSETTGLEPSRGDRMVQLAGVRIVNGRILKGEAFDRLINPGRRIPPASTRIHHIDDAMVADAPPAAAVLRQFHGFAHGAVLVAHNAAFDMRFLALEGAPAGLRFDQPVLDTVLLAAHLHGQEESLTLDALAERFAVDLPAAVRHTALGDTLATAEVFLRLLDMLAAQGVKTLNQALEASRGPQAIRRRQAAY